MIHILCEDGLQLVSYIFASASTSDQTSSQIAVGLASCRASSSSSSRQASSSTCEATMSSKREGSHWASAQDSHGNSIHMTRRSVTMATVQMIVLCERASKRGRGQAPEQQARGRGQAREPSLSRGSWLCDRRARQLVLHRGARAHAFHRLPTSMRTVPDYSTIRLCKFKFFVAAAMAHFREIKFIFIVNRCCCAPRCRNSYVPAHATPPASQQPRLAIVHCLSRQQCCGCWRRRTPH